MQHLSDHYGDFWDPFIHPRQNLSCIYILYNTFFPSISSVVSSYTYTHLFCPNMPFSQFLLSSVSAWPSYPKTPKVTLFNTPYIVWNVCTSHKTYLYILFSYTLVIIPLLPLSVHILHTFIWNTEGGLCKISKYQGLCTSMYFSLCWYSFNKQTPFALPFNLIFSLLTWKSWAFGRSCDGGVVTMWLLGMWSNPISSMCMQTPGTITNK